MRFLRSRRGLAGVGALAAVVGVTLFVVLPALASNPGDQVPPASTAGIVPVDVAIGGNGTCSNLFPTMSGVRQYSNPNPQNASGLPSGNNDGATFSLTLIGSSKQQRLQITSTHAAILGIGVNGGNDSTIYDYRAHGAVLGDSNLHAPASKFTVSSGVENPSQWYAISQLTVCYTSPPFIEGTVYQDVNQNGANDDNSPRSGWTVRLYGGVTPGQAGGGTVLASQQTTASGTYHFDLAPDGTHYRVCEVPRSSDTPPTGASGIWVETQPLPDGSTPDSAPCNGSGELARGYDFTPTSSTSKSDADFGNAGGFACGTNATSLGTSDYTVGICKGGQEYVFNQGTINDPSNPLDGTPFVDYWVGDPSQANMPTVEQINFDDPIIDGLPKYTKLLYADGGGFPPDLSNLLTMPYCQLDPRDTSASGYPNSFALQSQYSTLSGSANVLPGDNTSCVISIKVTAGPNDTGTLQAYVYALGDSGRLPQ